MDKKQLKAKYARISHDDSQLEMFKNDVIDGKVVPEPSASVTIEGSSLIIPEQPAPEPIITIDGVAYFHKCEFDLEEHPEIMTTYDLLSGEIISTTTGFKPYLMKSSLGSGPQSDSYVNNIYTGYNGHGGMLSFVLSSNYTSTTFVSHAFTIVDTQTEATDDSKICLPTCSAYYGFLSEDGKMFISYFNLKGEGGATKIDSVKQGNAVIPLAVMSGEATAGQVLTADGEGNSYWAASSGGVTEERVQEMIDAAIGDALTVQY